MWFASDMSSLLMDRSMIERVLFAGILLLMAACGPEVGAVGEAGGGDGSAGSSSEATDAVSGSSTSSSGAETGCFEIVYGSLSVDEGTDLGWLSTVREVTGQLTISSLSGTRDLGELRCLESVGGAMAIRRNPNLESLAGLEMIREVDDFLLVAENPRLRALDVPLERVRRLQVSSNPSLESLGLSMLEELEILEVGYINCPEFPDPETGLTPVIGGDNPLLQGIDRLESLRSDSLFLIAGQSRLVSTAGIVDVVDAHQQQFPDRQVGVRSVFWGNPNLSEAEVSKVFEAEGRESYGAAQACENRDDDRECVCAF